MLSVLLSLAVIVFLLRWSGIARPESRETLRRWLAQHRVDLHPLLAASAEDLRLLGRDVLRMLDPDEWRARLTQGRGPQRSRRVSGPRAPLRPAPASGIYEDENEAVRKLQRLYLSGSLTLERYVEELERLTSPTSGKREGDS